MKKAKKVNIWVYVAIWLVTCVGVLSANAKGQTVPVVAAQHTVEVNDGIK